MKRGSIKKTNSKLINVWFPDEVLPLIDVAVRVADSDRSKFIRNAVREKMDRMNIALSGKEAQ